MQEIVENHNRMLMLLIKSTYGFPSIIIRNLVEKIGCVSDWYSFACQCLTLEQIEYILATRYNLTSMFCTLISCI